MEEFTNLIFKPPNMSPIDTHSLKKGLPSHISHHRVLLNVHFGTPKTLALGSDTAGGILSLPFLYWKSCLIHPKFWVLYLKKTKKKERKSPNEEFCEDKIMLETIINEIPPHTC